MIEPLGSADLVPERERLFERVEHALGDQLGPGRQRHLRGHHDELMIAKGPECVEVAHDAVEPRGDRSRELITGTVTERVVGWT